MSAGVRQVSSRVRSCPSPPSQGFSLIELLIVMALSVSLLAWLGLGLSNVLGATQDAVSATALLERLAHTARFVTNLTERSAAMKTTDVGALCMAPSIASGVGVMVITGPTPRCLPLSSRRVQTPVLVVDVLAPCVKGCANLDFPRYLWLEPGCHPLFKVQTPQLRLLDAPGLPHDCSVVTTLQDWQRHVLYLRDYAWISGDGRGALMMKTLKASGQYSRADMLVADVLGWQINTHPLRLDLLMHSDSARRLSRDAVIMRLPPPLQPWASTSLPSMISGLALGVSVHLTLPPSNIASVAY